MITVLLSQYLDWLQNQRKVAPSTFRIYENVLGRYFADVVGDRHPSEVEIEEIEKWCQRDRTGGRAGLKVLAPSAATIARDGNVVRAFYKWAAARERWGYNPTDELVLPPVYNDEPKPIDDFTWDRWWGTVQGDAHSVLVLGFVGGLRRSEMCNLRSANIGAGTLEGVLRKGQVRDTIPIGTAAGVLERRLPHLGITEEVVVAALDAMRHNDPVLQFLDGRDERNRADGINRMLGTQARWYGLPPFTPHQLRHSCATNLLRAGMPIPMVSRYLNHRNIQTTMRYVRAGQGEMKEWAAQLA